jgi:hypothetical protein
MIEQLTARLAQLAALNQTTSYGTLARELGLQGPGTIAQLTTALESLMERDAAAGLPLRAALVNARNSTLPAQGFFDKAAALGFAVEDQVAFVSAQRAALGVH